MHGLTPERARVIHKLKRRHVNAMEAARLLDSIVGPDFSQAEAADALGFSQPWVANRIRLLGCSPLVREMIQTGALSYADGRALASLPEAIADHLAQEKIRNRWPTVTLERAASDYQKMSPGENPSKRGRKPK